MPSSSSPFGQVGQGHRRGALRRPGLGQLLQPAHARPLVRHVVGGDAVAHRHPLGGAGVGRLQPLHLRKELCPVRPAVGQHPVAVEHPLHDRLRRALAHQRHRVRAVGQPQLLDRCAVVDAGHHRWHRDLVGLDAGLVGQPLAAAGMPGAGAERVGAHLRRRGPHRQCLDRRGVGVVEHPRIGRHLGGVAGHVGQHRCVTERSHDPARPDRVADVHDDAVAAGDLEIVGPGVHAADRDGGDHEVGAGQRLALVGGAGDAQLAVLVGDQLVRQRLHHAQPALVDVHQRHLRGAQDGRLHQPPHQQRDEAAAASADDRDLGCHLPGPFAWVSSSSRRSWAGSWPRARGACAAA